MDFYPKRKSLLQTALLLTAVAPVCVYVAYRQVAPASPSHYIILAVAAVVAIYAAANWWQFALASRPLIKVGADSLKVRNPLSASYAEIPYASITDLRSEDEVKSNVLRHRFVAYVGGSPRELPTHALTDPAAAEQAILAAYRATK